MLNPTREERQVILLYFLTDMLVFWAALSLAVLARLDTLYEIDFLRIERDRWVCIAIFAAVAWLVGCYRAERIRDRFDSVYYMLIALAITGVGMFAVAALMPVRLRVISRTELAVSVMVAAVLFALWHYVAARLVSRLPSMHRFFYVLGDAKEGELIATEINESKSSRSRACYVTPEELRATMERERSGGNRMPVTEDAIVTLNGPGREHITRYLALCEEYCRHTYLYPSLDDTLLFQHQNLLSEAGLPLIEVARRNISTPYFLVKRTVDMAVSAVGLVLLSPLLLLTAAAVATTSRGGVFYRQERLGRDGKPFNILKFRSMIEDPDAPNRPYVRAKKDDPRITFVGRRIRKYKIDELPQLFNVLKGDMSLIGPRPLWRAFFAENGEESSLWERRLAVRPGVTSLLHVQGHSFAKASDFVRYDLIYINNLSLLNDLKILIGTIRIVLSGKGSEC